MKHDIKLKGFVRTALEDIRGPHKGRVQMSDWTPNAIVTEGLTNYICGPVGSIAGSKLVGYMQVASQTAAVAASQTSAVGEFSGTDGARKATTNTFISAGTCQFVASWATNEANQSNLGAAALYNTSAAGSCASIALFSTSAKTTDQTLSITYQYRFTTA